LKAEIENLNEYGETNQSLVLIKEAEDLKRSYRGENSLGALTLQGLKIITLKTRYEVTHKETILEELEKYKNILEVVYEGEDLE